MIQEPGTDHSCCSPVQPQTNCCGPAEGQYLESAVSFRNDMRPHVSLNVRSVKESLPFYRVLFDQRPTKLKEDYAKWELENPPINFTINEHPDSADRDGHFGIQVKSSRVVQDCYERFRQLKVKIDTTETEVACCFSVQNKVWVVDPDGNHWEVFVVTEEDADDGCGPTCLCYNPETGGCQW